MSVDVCADCGMRRPRWHGGKHECLLDDSCDYYSVGNARFVLSHRELEFLRADYAGL